MRDAAHVLECDPDAAALLLDGLLRAIAVLARQRQGICDPHFGLRLRLGLRAPNVEARLAHCQELLRLIEADDEGDNNDVG